MTFWIFMNIKDIEKLIGIVETAEISHLVLKMKVQKLKLKKKQ